MRIAVTAMGSELTDEVSARFGRAPYFLIVNTDDATLVEAVENPNVASGGGAGVQSAQLLTDLDVEVVLTGNCGPNAFQVFRAAGTKVIVVAGGSVQETVEQFKAGELSEAKEANVPPHAGMNT